VTVAVALGTVFVKKKNSKVRLLVALKDFLKKYLGHFYYFLFQLHWKALQWWALLVLLMNRRRSSPFVVPGHSLTAAAEDAADLPSTSLFRPHNCYPQKLILLLLVLQCSFHYFVAALTMLLLGNLQLEVEARRHTRCVLDNIHYFLENIDPYLPVVN